MPKISLLATVLFFISLNFLSSCKTDFDVNAPYKEEYIVYGLLELHNPVQIIKIEKVFQNNSSVTASQAAQTEDSLNTSDNLVVQLIQYGQDGSKLFVSLVKYYDLHKEPGVFASPGQYLYRTPDGFTLSANAIDTLTIYNPKTGYRGIAGTTVVGDISPQNPTSGTQINLILTGTGSAVAFTEGANATSYDVNIKIPISEWRKQNSQLLRRDTLVFNVVQNYNQQGGLFRQYVQSVDFYNFIRSSLTVDSSIYRKMDSLDFVITGAGTDLTNYIQVNVPTLGIAQKTPQYTNVTNGLGIFSSRLTNEVKAPLSSASFSVLAGSDITKLLNFRK